MSPVARVHTRPEHTDFFVCLSTLRPEMSESSLALLWAQYIQETGWGKQCFNWNLGNRKARRDAKGIPSEPYTVLHTREIIDEQEVYIDDAFAAFESLQAGMEDWISFLSGPSRSACWEALLSGDANLYGLRLKEARYYTERLVVYQASLRSLQKDGLAIVQHLEIVPPNTQRDHPPAKPPEWEPQTSLETALPSIFGSKP